MIAEQKTIKKAIETHLHTMHFGINPFNKYNKSKKENEWAKQNQKILEKLNALLEKFDE